MTDRNIILNKLQEIVAEENVLTDEPLHNYTMTRLGGVADYFVTPTTIAAAQQLVAFAAEERIPLMSLGNGSNVIVKDGGIRGIVMSLKKLNELTVEGDRMTVQSGIDIRDASKAALQNCLTGLEFACGIPGSIGGALVMNAGAYGGEIKDVIDSVVVVSEEGELVTLLKDDLQLGYRTSVIPKKKYTVLQATFQLQKGDYDSIKSVMDDLTQRREEKQPLEYPSCGSVFKRPPGYFAGKLIQDSGLQGTRVGGAEVSRKHAGFIVNKDGATATDYISLIKIVQRTVKETFGVELETEVKIVGEDPIPAER
ncbi:UDP-N-acetylmuramate dehydrogenase [Numidum massiliense]|uniref:UDP-N-acetylmuramate dehydrogenase n=1 Tax=Numidum massiliense TaxID=1522315 RepID=UPI0006D59FA7|nr:UDP-N-acetylmuramate dehydrogenase [Numidum massiliense]